MVCVSALASSLHCLLSSPPPLLLLSPSSPCSLDLLWHSEEVPFACPQHVSPLHSLHRRCLPLVQAHSAELPQSLHPGLLAIDCRSKRTDHASQVSLLHLGGPAFGHTPVLPLLPPHLQPHPGPLPHPLPHVRFLQPHFAPDLPLHRLLLCLLLDLCLPSPFLSFLCSFQSSPEVDR